MEYHASAYEVLTRRMFVNWCIVLDSALDRTIIERALVCVHSKHPSLRCKLQMEKSLGSMILKEEEHIRPCVTYEDGNINDLDMQDRFERLVDENANNSSYDDIVRYTVRTDDKHHKTAIIACFCHSFVDGLSSIRVAVDLLHYLDHPNAETPESRSFVSVQNELALDKCQEASSAFEGQNEKCWIAPSRLHEDDPSHPSYFRTFHAILPNEEMSDYLSCCKKHGCSFQSFLWLSLALSQIRLFRKTLPLSIRFSTPVTTVGRAQFIHPITNEDLVIGAYSVFVQQELLPLESFWSVCKTIHTKMRKEIEEGKQLSDFFSICRTMDFGKLPPASFNGCTLGKTELKREYKTFEMEDFYLLPCCSRVPGMGGMNLHAFSIEALGCIMNFTYCYPAFTPEDMRQYSSNVMRIMKTVVDTDHALNDILDVLYCFVCFYNCNHEKGGKDDEVRTIPREYRYTCSCGSHL